MYPLRYIMKKLDNESLIESEIAEKITCSVCGEKIDFRNGEPVYKQTEQEHHHIFIKNDKNEDWSFTSTPEQYGHEKCLEKIRNEFRTAYVIKSEF